MKRAALVPLVLIALTAAGPAAEPAAQSRATPDQKPSAKPAADAPKPVIPERKLTFDVSDDEKTMSFNVADDMEGLLKTRAPVDYYRARNIEGTYAQTAPFYEKGWCCCDKEILAEDYRVLFTSSRRPHRMAEPSYENSVARGAPPAIARDWLWRLFRPQSAGQAAWPFPM